MSGLLRDLVGDQGCEGTASNPITSLFNNAVDYSRQQQLADEIADPASLASSSGASSSIAPVLTPFTKIPTNINVGMQDKSKIRARSELLARHLFPGQTEQYIEQQLSPFFERLNLPGSTGLDRYGKQNQKTFFNLGGSASKSLSEEDMDDLSMEGEVERLDDYLEQGNVDVQAAYDKYMEYMKQTLDLGHIQKTTEKYQCAPQNPMLGNAKAFEVGVQMHQQGDLIRAIQAFEAAVQQDAQNHAAWERLGVCHAECDDDHSAILAYTQAVNADPQNLEALLQLGVSYTNELNKMRALVYLKTWLSNHPSYAQIVKQNPTEDDEENLYNYYHFQQQVLGLFNAAKQQNPQDADLYAVLGVMYNISNEYEKAVESFQNALKYRPQDYSLWNKLGATLANGSRSQEAVEAYRKALKLKPNYVRAWINLGIAYANQRQHQEAIKYYLRAISMCPKADSVWQYLGMALTCIERPDLVELCKHKDVNLFRKHYNF